MTDELTTHAALAVRDSWPQARREYHRAELAFLSARSVALGLGHLAARMPACEQLRANCPGSHEDVRLVGRFGHRRRWRADCGHPACAKWLEEASRVALQAFAPYRPLAVLEALRRLNADPTDVLEPREPERVAVEICEIEATSPWTTRVVLEISSLATRADVDAALRRRWNEIDRSQHSNRREGLVARPARALYWEYLSSSRRLTQPAIAKEWERRTELWCRGTKPRRDAWECAAWEEWDNCADPGVEQLVERTIRRELATLRGARYGPSEAEGAA